MKRNQRAKKRERGSGADDSDGVDHGGKLVLLLHFTPLPRVLLTALNARLQIFHLSSIFVLVGRAGRDLRMCPLNVVHPFFWMLAVPCRASESRRAESSTEEEENCRGFPDC